MKTKTKIMAFVSLASLTMVLLMVGVWALKTVNFTVGGNLSYIAPGIEATISKGTVTNGVWVNAGDASTKMPITQITRQDTEESLTTKFSYWQDLNLNFNETGDDVTITFSITNDMEEKYLSINVTTSYESADNSTISLNTSSANLAPDALQSFTITMKVTDKTANASLSDFSIVFNMSMTEYTPPTKAEDVSYLTFEYDSATMEATLTGYDGKTADVVIPEQIVYNNKTYTVTSMTTTSYDGDNYRGIFAENNILESVIWPSTITTINQFTFAVCKNLFSIVIPEGVTEIGRRAFWQCFSITTISMPNSLIILGEDSFTHCAELTSVTIGSGVTSIGNYAFSSCTGLTSITIPDKVTSIGSSAFYRCTSLATVEVKATSVPTGGYDMFLNCPLTTGIFVPSGSEDDYKSATYWSAYADYIKAGSF